MKKVSLIIPTYNEARNLPLFFEEIDNIIDKRKFDLEYIVVDDNSPDETWKVAEGLSEKYPIKVIRRSGKLGLGSAVREGFDASNREIMGVMDADLSHDPVILNELLEFLGENDIAIGSRFADGSEVENWAFFRRLTSEVGVWFTKMITGVKDPLTGYFFFKRSVINNIKLKTIGYKILFEILVKGDYKKVKEIAFKFRDRKFSTSKLNYKEYLLFAGQILKYYFYKLYKNHIWALLLVFVFSCLALFVSFNHSIWLDEGLNIKFSLESVSVNIERSMSADLHPPLYYIFQHYITKVFGEGIIIFRLLSLVFYMLSAIAFYRYFIYKKILDKKKILLFLLLFLSSPFVFFYASEARSYMFIIFISLLQIISFDKIFDKNENLKKQLLIYTVSSIIGVYTYYTIIFLMVAQFFYVIFLKREYFKKILNPWFVTFLFYLPWIYFVIISRIGVSPGHFLSIPWWQIPAIIFLGFGGGRVGITDLNHLHHYWPSIIIFLANILPLFGFFLWIKLKKNREYLVRLSFLFFIPIIICLLISFFRFSVFDPRYYTEIFPLFIILLCFSLFYLFKHNKRVALFVVSVLVISNIVINVLYVANPWYGREPWKKVVYELESRLEAGEPVVFIGYHQPPSTYYLYQTKETNIISTHPEDLKDSQNYDKIEEHLLGSIGDSDIVWFSQFLEWQKDPDKKIRAMLDKDFEYKETIGFFKVKFDLYERK